MKNYKYLLLGLLTMSLAACSNSTKTEDYMMGLEGGGDAGYPEAFAPGEGGYAGKGGSGATATDLDAGEDGDYGDVDEEPQQNTQIPAGQLTCSALNDNLFYDYWKELTSVDQSGQKEEYGPFYNYREDIKDSFVTYNRVKLTVNNANDIYVTLKNEKKVFHVDNFHNAYCFSAKRSA